MPEHNQRDLHLLVFIQLLDRSFKLEHLFFFLPSQSMLRAYLHFFLNVNIVAVSDIDLMAAHIVWF